MRPAVITINTLNEIKRLRDYAEDINHWHRLQDRFEIRSGKLPKLSERPEHTMFIDPCYCVIYSIDHSVNGVFTHMTVSITDKIGGLPHPTVVNEILEHFSMNPIENTYFVGMSEVTPEKKGIRIYQEYGKH